MTQEQQSDSQEAARRTGDQWRKVAAHLRSILLTYAVDQPLPSEAELVEKLGVARNTVRRAYAHLIAEGVVRVDPHVAYYRVGREGLTCPHCGEEV